MWIGLSKDEVDHLIAFNGEHTDRNQVNTKRVRRVEVKPFGNTNKVKIQRGTVEREYRYDWVSKASCERLARILNHHTAPWVEIDGDDWMPVVHYSF